jgi:hypothetical protein
MSARGDRFIEQAYQRGRRPGEHRAGRGVNQERVLAAWTTTEIRASRADPQGRTGAAGSNQVLKALIKNGTAENTGHGLYRLTSGGGTETSSGDESAREARAPRAARTPLRRPRDLARWPIPDSDHTALTG